MVKKFKAEKRLEKDLTNLKSSPKKLKFSQSFKNCSKILEKLFNFNPHPVYSPKTNSIQ
jgi:hypothetical protein